MSPAPEELTVIPIVQVGDSIDQVKSLRIAVRHLARITRTNVLYGLEMHQVFTSVPTTADVEEGQFVLGKDGAS